MTSFRPIAGYAAMALIFALTGCGNSGPVSDIPNSQMIDVNAVDVDPGTMGDASAVEAIGRADVDMTGQPPAVVKSATLSNDNDVNKAEAEKSEGQTASVQASGDKGATETGNIAGP